MDSPKTPDAVGLSAESPGSSTRAPESSSVRVSLSAEMRNIAEECRMNPVLSHRLTTWAEAVALLEQANANLRASLILHERTDRVTMAPEYWAEMRAAAGSEEEDDIVDDIQRLKARATQAEADLLVCQREKALEAFEAREFGERAEREWERANAAEDQLTALREALAQVVEERDKLKVMMPADCESIWCPYQSEVKVLREKIARVVEAMQPYLHGSHASERTITAWADRLSRLTVSQKEPHA